MTIQESSGPTGARATFSGDDLHHLAFVADDRTGYDAFAIVTEVNNQPFDNFGFARAFGSSGSFVVDIHSWAIDTYEIPESSRITEARVSVGYDEESSGHFLSPIPGDITLDGMVDATDLNVLALNWNQITNQIHWRRWQTGDFNGDLWVDMEDLNALAMNWRHGTVGTAAVPEPSSIMLLLIAALQIKRVRRPNKARQAFATG